MEQRKTGSAAVRDRVRVMRRDNGLCQECFRHGILTAAQEVDHIQALVNGGSDSDDNKEALCLDCHVLKTRDDKGLTPSAACDVNGMPRDKRHHWNQ
jgi:5-methylcytosine-specific restriction enzyme A